MTTLIALAALTASPQSPQITDYVQSSFRDASLMARVLKGDQRELRKINDDFGQSYRFETTNIKLKEPFKMRIEANVEDTSMLYIINGPTQVIKVPRAKVNIRQDLSKKPGRRQTLLDFGLLTASLFDDYMTARFVRNDRATGAVVFDITYVPQLDDTTRHRIWIDPSRHYVMKREWYNQRGNQIATFLYENPKNENGVWIPTRLTVKNNDDKVAGETRYDAIKINQGLSDDLFATK